MCVPNTMVSEDLRGWRTLGHAVDGNRSARAMMKSQSVWQAPTGSVIVGQFALT